MDTDWNSSTRYLQDPQRWGVVGGGVLGMTLAMRLRQAGHDVTIIEGADSLGGLTATWSIGGVTWDKHYHVILLSDSNLRAVLDELGLDPKMNWRTTKTGCYTDGALYSVSDTIEFLRFPPLTMVDKLRLGWTIFLASRIGDPLPLEQVTAADWLTRHSGRRAYEKFWKPLLKSKLGDNHKQASAAFIWAIIHRLYAARRTGLKKEMFGYVEGGYATILDTFATRLEELGVETILRTRVQRVGQSSPELIDVELPDRTLQFDRVVLTTAAPMAARLIDGLSEPETETMTSVMYQGIICASMLTESPISDYYVTNFTDEVPFTGIIEMSALVDRDVFDGKSLIYLPRYTTQDDPALNWSDEEVEDRFLSKVEQLYPSFHRNDVVDFKISRVRYVLPVATLDYSSHIPPISTTMPGVFTVNSSQIVNGTLNVNESIQLAESAMSELLNEDHTKHPTMPTQVGTNR